MNKIAKQNIYFLGIGGIGMSALARYFYQKGCVVSGYDKTPSPLTKRLEEEGILIHYEDNPQMIPDNLDFVVLTPAIPGDSLELNYLREKNVRIIKRAEVLGEISRQCRSVAVAGSHGKTTVTALITHLLNYAGKKMSAFVGGIAKNIDSNVIIGDENDEIVVMEADEFDRSFLQLTPYISIVTSIDADCHASVVHEKEMTSADLATESVDLAGILVVVGRVHSSHLQLLSFDTHCTQCDVGAVNLAFQGKHPECRSASGFLGFRIETDFGFVYESFQCVFRSRDINVLCCNPSNDVCI